MEFVIPGRLPSLNDYTLANRRNKWAGNKMKRECEEMITEFIPEYRPKFDYPVSLNIDWYEKDIRRDYDNVVFGKKFILDALVTAGVLVDDKRKYVIGGHDEVKTDKGNPRIEVHIG